MKLMAVVLRLLRLKGLRLCFYLNDIIVMADSKEKAEEHGQILKEHLSSLGWLLSKKKCIWEASQQWTFLGFIVDTMQMELRLPGEKLWKIRKEMKALMGKEYLKIRKVAAVIGLLNSTSQAIFPARFRLWSLIQEVQRVLLVQNENWDGNM